MTALAHDTGGFWRRTGAMLLKEFLQLRRDRLTLATMITIPLMQLLLFGYAINTMPRDLPTAVLLQENSDVGRSILKALENTRFFKVTRIVRDEAEFDQLLQSGTVLFAVEVPANFERALRRGDRPALLVAADATDPVASGSALGALGELVQTALVNDHAIPDSTPAAFEIRPHARYNPAGESQLVADVPLPPERGGKGDIDVGDVAQFARTDDLDEAPRERVVLVVEGLHHD